MGEMTTSQQKCRSALLQVNTFINYYVLGSSDLTHHPGTPASYCTGDSYGCPPNHNHQLQHYCHRFGSNRSSVSRLLCTQSGCLRTIQAVLQLQGGWWRWRQTHDICRPCDRCLVRRSCKKGVNQGLRGKGRKFTRSEPNPTINDRKNMSGLSISINRAKILTAQIHPPAGQAGIAAGTS
jgi:hypothetical protein